jgi:hypothetical protein
MELTKMHYLIIGLVVLVIAFYFRPSLSLYNKPKPAGELTLYGSETCGWCKKQLTELEGLNVKYVNCKESAAACSALGITAYPTFVLPDGTQLKGFQTRDKITPYINAPVGK